MEVSINDACGRPHGAISRLFWLTYGFATLNLGDRLNIVRQRLAG